MAWFVGNLGTILTAGILILLVTGIVLKMVKDHKEGKSSCGGNCANCRMCSGCHQVSAEKKEVNRQVSHEKKN